MCVCVCVLKRRGQDSIRQVCVQPNGGIQMQLPCDEADEAGPSESGSRDATAVVKAEQLLVVMFG